LKIIHRLQEQKAYNWKKLFKPTYQKEIFVMSQSWKLVDILNERFVLVCWFELIRSSSTFCYRKFTSVG